jgi:glycyl-tRNA synthetase alpha subunit
VFNTLQARGVISVAERQAYIGRVREMAKGACAAWMEQICPSPLAGERGARSEAVGGRGHDAL